MSTMAQQTPLPITVSPHLASRLSRLTVWQYDRMIENGTFVNAEDVELIEGLLVTKMGRNRPHEQAGKKGLAALLRIAPSGWHVAKEDPIVASDWSKPEPDLALVRGRVEDYADRDVTAGDVGLTVEIADSSLAADREVMGRLYAAGGIPVYWIVNVKDRQLEVYANPVNGAYPAPRILGETESVELVIDGQVLGQIAIADLLPRRS
jgi:Uma2 family endonuclease